MGWLPRFEAGPGARRPRRRRGARQSRTTKLLQGEAAGRPVDIAGQDEHCGARFVTPIWFNGVSAHRLPLTAPADHRSEEPDC